MNFVALLSFTHVANHGGMSAASTATGLPKATLSRHVRQLETSLGVRLIERGSNTLRLTEDGAALHARTSGLLMEILDAAQTFTEGSGQARGLLRVSVPVLFAHMAVGRLASEFAALHPEVRLDISAEDRIVDLVAEGYDAVVRVNPQDNPNLVGRCFLRERHVVVASPRVSVSLDERGMRSAPAVIRGGTREVPVWHVHQEGDVVEIRPEPAILVSSLPMVRDAVRAGLGAAVLPFSLVSEDLAEGCLTLWGAASGQDVELWAMHTSRRFVSPKVRAFIDFLCSAFGD